MKVEVTEDSNTHHTLSAPYFDNFSLTKVLFCMLNAHSELIRPSDSLDNSDIMSLLKDPG